MYKLSRAIQKINSEEYAPSSTDMHSVVFQIVYTFLTCFTRSNFYFVLCSLQGRPIDMSEWRHLKTSAAALSVGVLQMRSTMSLNKMLAMRENKPVMVSSMRTRNRLQKVRCSLVGTRMLRFYHPLKATVHYSLHLISSAARGDNATQEMSLSI
jgi:hypothetical protein